MIKIRFNYVVRDKYTGTMYEIGQEVEVTKERFEELKDFDADLVTFIKEVEDKKPGKSSKEDKSKDEKPVDDTSKEDKEEK